MTITIETTAATAGGAHHPTFPSVDMTVTDQGTAVVTINGARHELDTGDVDAARHEAVQYVAVHAARLVARPVLVTVTDPAGVFTILIDPDGAVTIPERGAAPQTRPDHTTTPPPDAVPSPPVDRTTELPAQRVLTELTEPPAARDELSVVRWTTATEHQGRTAGSSDRPAETGPLNPASPLPSAAQPPQVDEGAALHPDDHLAPAPADPTAHVPPAQAPTGRVRLTRVDDHPHAPAPAETPLPPVPAPTAAPAHPDASSLPTLDDLLVPDRSEHVVPAQTGLRGLVRTITDGRISPAPSARELEQRRLVQAIQRGLDAPKTIVVVNPKGGSTKTAATLLLAATIGTHRGGSTLAWDNNETRGTMGWQTKPSPNHANTAVALLRDLDRLNSGHGLRVGDLDQYVRSQGNAHFDVLASDEDAASTAAIDDAKFHALHAVLARMFRVLIVDTGNNMRAPNWRAAVQAADQLVIASSISEPVARSAAWLIDGLRADGKDDLVAGAVTVLTDTSQESSKDRDLRQRLETHFGRVTREVHHVPYDRALDRARTIDIELVSDHTRSAWLGAAAAVVAGL